MHMKAYKGVTAKTATGRWHFDFITDGTTHYDAFTIGSRTLAHVEVTDALIRDVRADAPVVLLIRRGIRSRLVVGARVGGKKVRIAAVLLRVMLFEAMLFLILMLLLMWATGNIALAVTPLLLFTLLQAIALVRLMRF
jgi:hypothetical protein